MGEWNRYTAQTKIEDLSRLCRANYQIDPEFYSKYDVKRGLRDINGKVGRYVDLMSSFKVFPVLNVRLTRKIF